MAPHAQDSIPIWGDPNKAAGTFGTVEKSQETFHGDFDTIPLIDISSIFSANLEDRIKVGQDLRDACLEIGFFYVTGHGIPDEMIDGVFEVAKTFFGLSFEEKMEVFINNQKNYRGYTPLGGSGTKDKDGKGNANEAFDFGHDRKLNDDPAEICADRYMEGDNVWPRQLPEFEVRLSEYYCRLRDFCRIMARNVALSLDIAENHFDPLITHPGCSCVVAHYPPQAEKDGRKLGLDPHTDAELFTILAPGDVRALEVLNRDGYWISAPPKRGCFIVNVGDQLQRLTANRYISTKHRVVNYSGEERYSIPFFFSVNWETIIEPITSLVEEGEIISPRNVTAGQMYWETMAGLHLIAEKDADLLKYKRISA